MKPILLVLFSMLTALGLCRHAQAAGPNVVYILCDDLGVGDLKPYNDQSKIATPHIDRLASEGMRFSDAHSGSAVCTPTRYGIMCGRYAWRTRLQNGVLGGLSPSLIAADQWTVPKLLKQRNYHSACIGKWHLGLDWQLKPGKTVEQNSIEALAQNHNVEYNQPFGGGPVDVGFDEYFGISGSLDMVPYVYLKNRTVTESPTEEKSFGMRFADDKNRTRKGPASPGFTAEDVMPRLTQEAIAYLERRAAAADGQPFFMYVPFASPHTPTAPSPAWQGKSGLNAYADFVMQQDDSVGQILAALDKLKLSENTIVIFTSDNGCSNQADLPALRAKGHDPVRPFRGHKADIFEGGHRVPLLVRWPGTVPAGSHAEQTVCLVDTLATLADIAQIPLPEGAGPDSFSMLPLLKNPQAIATRPSTVHHSINGSFALRRGPYKLCFCDDSGGWTEPKPGKVNPDGGVQLYNLANDIAETKSIASEQSVIVSQLALEMETIIARGRSTRGPDLKNDVPVNLWKRAKRVKPLHETIIDSLPDMALRSPAWRSLVVQRESSVLLQMEPAGAIESRLAFAAEEILAIRSADGQHSFELGRDCTLSDDRLRLIWKSPTKLEAITAAQMFPPKDAPNSYRHRVSNPEQNMFYAPGKFFHQHDVEVTYRRAIPPAANASVAGTPAGQLTRTLEKLRVGKALRIGMSGDSISTGLDASGTTQTAPNQPGYPELVAAQLTKDFSAQISLDNRSVAGWSIANGLQDLDAMLGGHPDLLIVAYGMNDVGRRDPAWFAEQAKTLEQRARASLPEIEILWVAPMLGHQEWVHTPREMFAKYRDELQKRVGPHGDLADLTDVWTVMLQHKHDLDLTGNGLNHPNDFGHRLYAQSVLECLPK